VADVQVAIRLRREARVRAPAVLSGVQVSVRGPDEIRRLGGVGPGVAPGYVSVLICFILSP
jgi:hypothetical protein